jgi:hypothetical protein
MIPNFIINIIVFFISISPFTLTGVLLDVKISESWMQTVDKYNSKQKQEFILGVLMNNIHFLDEIPILRETEKNVSLKQIFSTDDPFEAGSRFFHYIAEKREKTLQKWGVEEMIGVIPKNHLKVFISLLEDEVIYSKLLSGKASSYLSGISEGEILTGVRVEKLAIWHGVLYKFFSEKPSSSIMSLQKDKRLNFPISEESVQFWKTALIFYSQNKKIIDYVTDLQEELEKAYEIFSLKHLNSK